MVSVFPAGTLPETFPELPFPSLNAGTMPWDCPEPKLQQTGSPKPIISSSSISEESIQNHVNSSSNNTDDQKITGMASATDERKRRRMISNRESARRSRMRKQKHLENLRNQANRLRIQNRELANKLRFVLYHCHRVRTDNAWLRSERVVLQQKLAYVGQVILLQQQQQHQQFDLAWPCNDLISCESIRSIIT